MTYYVTENNLSLHVISLFLLFYFDEETFKQINYITLKIRVAYVK